ncbi:carbohydrate ABC transporter permease [Phytoactinopolyspora endophytica]|uniref:carbohydrate ABC transporter permease n=1 Tax=Phytoactinopolyspora endophytica TaxID=1642495 RepID=UPI00101BE964|nr:sugar ABC transporter permease [Phytoactinopolyspora endophytica]
MTTRQLLRTEEGTRRGGRGARRGPPPQSGPTGGGSFWYVVPMIVILGLSSIVPIVYSLSLSLFDWDWGSRLAFVGLANYVDLLGDGEFWASLSRTGLFTILAVAFEIVLGMLIAVAVQSMTRGLGWLRTLFILPLMVSGMVVALVWKVMLDPTLGVIPFLLGKVGLSGIDLLGSATTALPALAGIDTWWQTGFVFIILSAGLAALPREPFEAASVDGASAISRFRFLTVPMMLPMIGTVAAIRAVECLKVFALAFGTTNGGPARSTDFAQMLAYRTGFREFRMSESMTMMITYTLLIVIALVVVSLVRKAVHHAA